MHIGTVAERIHGASRRFRRRFESRLGHFLSRTRMCTELDGMLRNQVRSPQNPFLTVFSPSNLVQPWLRLTFKKSNLSQGQMLAIFAACFELCSLWWPMLPMIKLVKHYKLSLYFQISGVILPRKYSLIKVFKNRFFYNLGD